MYNLHQTTNEQIIFSVSPTVIVREQVVGGWAGELLTLECIVEAWPEPVNYWEKDGKLIQVKGT